ELQLTVVGQRDAAAAALENFAGAGSLLRREGADGRFDRRGVGDDIDRGPAAYQADGYDGRIGRIGFAADEFLQAGNRLARGDDRIRPEVVVGAVTTLADESGEEIIGGREERAGFGRDGSDFQSGPAV